MNFDSDFFQQRVSTFLDLGFSEEKLGQLEAYLKLLCQTNDEMNLVSRQMTFQELVDNHVIDCLLPLKKMPSSLKKIADLGSGGGLPGVIYAINFPETVFYLHEKSPKKREFLEACVKIAPNLVVCGEISKTFGSFDLVTARAFKPIDVILDMTRSYYAAGGRYFLLKGKIDKIELEIKDSQKKFKDLTFKVDPLKSPVMDVERHVVTLART